MSDISLEVNGVRYSGWEGVGVTRSIESVSDSFSLQVSDRGSEWPIVEEDQCKVLIEGETILTGSVERPIPSFTESASNLNVSGYGKSGVLAQCSAILDRWSFINKTVVDIARIVCEPFGIVVNVQPGLELIKAPRKLVINPGETAFDVIKAAAASSGVLVHSTHQGGIMITRSGVRRTCDPLIQGLNLIAGSGDYDASIRYYRYVVLGQTAGTDQANAGATRLRGEAIDEGVRRTDRVLLVRSEAAHNVAYNNQRADWEARNRAAAAKAASVSVRGWRQSNGVLWPVNALVPVTSSKLRIADEERLISEVQFSKDASGEITTLRVVRPDAFEPDPTARVKK